jgi:hypothetical protein
MQKNLPFSFFSILFFCCISTAQGRLGQYNNAQELVNTLPSTSDGTALKTVYNIVIGIHQQHLSTLQLTAAQEASLSNIANGADTKAKPLAQAILESTGRYSFDQIILLASPEAPRIQAPSSNNNPQSSEELLIQPNPNNDIALVSWKLKNVSIQGELIEVFDFFGVQIKSLAINDLNGSTNLELSDMPSGIYFLKLKSLDQILVTKFIISH